MDQIIGKMSAGCIKNDIYKQINALHIHLYLHTHTHIHTIVY